MCKFKKLGLVLIFGCNLFTSCNKHKSYRFSEPSIEESLKLAKDNKGELEKVLKHYRDLGDPQKLEAAEFLIKNMPGNYTGDTTILKHVQKIYKLFNSNKGLSNPKLKRKISKDWENASKKFEQNPNFYVQDVEVIKSGFLIKNIESAFDSWKSNPFTKDKVSFEDFCEYILPYRQDQGVCLEDWRSYFKGKHQTLFNNYPFKTLSRAIDSVCLDYEHIKWTQRHFNGLPFFKFSDLLYAGGCTCPKAAWLNKMIYASSGVPVATDFVHIWGDKSKSHAWSSLVYENESKRFGPFEATNNRWVNIYDNNNNDFKLPKVFRKTYATYIDKPLLDPRVDLDNIPSLFLNVKKRDVSSDYFKTFDVTVDFISNIPENTYYTYLAVFGRNKWEPIHYAAIENGSQTTFKGMGAGIVYLPIFYKKGKTIPASYPFLLNNKGNIKYFIPSSVSTDVKVLRKYRLSYTNIQRANNLKGLRFFGANNKNFSDKEIIHQVPKSKENIPSKINFVEFEKITKKFKYLGVEVDKRKDVVDIAEVSFYTADNSMIESDIIDSNTPLDQNESTKLFDGSIANFVSFIPKKNSWFAMELKAPQSISKISFCPRNDTNHILLGDTYELLYFKDEWKTLGLQKAKKQELRFNNVPKNALLWLRNLTKGVEERIFVINNNGEQIFY